MPIALLLVFLSATALPALAALPPSWVGMTAEANQPQNVSLFGLGSSGQRQASVYNFQLPANTHLTPDAFRCKPYGSFCLVMCTSGTPQQPRQPPQFRAAALQTVLFNISLTNPPPAGQAPPSIAIDGFEAYNLHVHHTTGAAYTVLLKPGQAQVVEIFQGVWTPLVDLSQLLTEQATIAPGGTTQCSNTNYMWVGIQQGRLPNGTVSDLIAVIALDQARLVSVFPLRSPLPLSLWASCAGTADDTLGGATPLGQNQTEAAYGTLDDQGLFTATCSGTIPVQTPPLRMTALLSEPLNYDFFFPLYPAGAQPGGPATKGYLAFGNFGHSQLTFQPIDYYLTGAARLH